MASRGSRRRRPRISAGKTDLEAIGMEGMVRAVHTWIQTRKGWNRTDKRTALENLDEVIELIVENEEEG